MVIRCTGVVCSDVVCAYATCRVTAGEALTVLGNNGMNPVKLLEFRTFLWFGLDIGMIGKSLFMTTHTNFSKFLGQEAEEYTFPSRILK